MIIRKIGLRPALSVDVSASLRSALTTIDQAEADCALVVSNSVLIGIIARNDIGELLARAKVAWDDPVGEYSTQIAFHIDEDDDAYHALVTMRRYAVDFAPVWRDEKIAGIISRTAIARALRAEMRARLRKGMACTRCGYPVFGKTGRRRAV